MSAIREQCSCGSAIRVDHSDPAPIAREWRTSHPCDRRDRAEREVVSGAAHEQSYAAPHRTDTELHFGFQRDDTEPIGLPPLTRRDLREVM